MRNRRPASKPVNEMFRWPCPPQPIILRWDKTDRPFSCQLHYHPAVFELHIVRKGSCRYLINRRFFSPSGYSAFVIKPPLAHQHFNETGQWLQQVMIMVDQSMLTGRRALSIARRLPEKIALGSEELNGIEMRCRIIEHELQHPFSASRLMLQNELENIILLLQRAGKGKTTMEPADPRIIRIIHCIETNYAQDLNIEQLASLAAMSPGHLSHRFKQQTRISIKHYILQCRIAAAKTSLETMDDVKMTVLAERLGFNNLSLFYRCFQHFTGMTPGAYRRISHKNRRIRQ